MKKLILIVLAIMVVLPLSAEAGCYPSYSYSYYPRSYYPSYYYPSDYYYEPPVKKVYVSQYVPVVVGVPTYGASYTPQALSNPIGFNTATASPCDAQLKEYKEKLTLLTNKYDNLEKKLEFDKQLQLMRQQMQQPNYQQQPMPNYQQQPVAQPNYQQQVQQQPVPNYQQQPIQPQVMAPQATPEVALGNLKSLLTNKCAMCHDEAHANNDGGKLVLLRGLPGSYSMVALNPAQRNEIINQLWTKKMPKIPKGMSKEQYDNQLAITEQDFSTVMDGLSAMVARKE